MRKRFLFCSCLAVLFFTLTACNEHIFYTISQEVKPVPPLIDGSPTNLVIFDNAIYVATGKTLHSYSHALWNKETFPDKIAQVASTAGTNSYLYKISYQGSSAITTLSRKSKSQDWADIGGISGNGKIQYIFAAQDVLFAGVETSGVFSIYYVDNNTLADLGCPGEISGAAWDGKNYFLCTNGDGIFTTSDPSNEQALLIDGTEGIKFAGIISLGNGAATPILSGEIAVTQYTIYADQNTGDFVYLEIESDYKGSENVSYQWYIDGELIDDETDSSIIYNELGLFTVTVSAAGYVPKTSGIFLYEEDSLNNLNGTLNISPSGDTPKGTTLTSAYLGSETVNYQWYKNGELISGATGNTFTPDADGCYFVSLSAVGYVPKTSPAVNIYTLTTSNIVAIARDGNLYEVTETGISGSIASLGRLSTGALAIWRDSSNIPRLLLAGRQDKLAYTTDSGYTYGYMEINISSGMTTGDFIEPGKSAPSTVSDNERFKSTIGKHPVNYLLQSPPEIDPYMTLFASTQLNGVWSYRNRNGVEQWNAENQE